MKIPTSSILYDWLIVGSGVETPDSFMLAVALSGLGVLLKRQIWVDLGKAGRVYPNISSLLVGKAGLGKDTAINIATRQIIWPFAGDININSNTTEGIIHALFCLQREKMMDPACGYIVAPELTALFGGKDYQKGMAAKLTDLLSTNDRFSDSTKGEGQKVILNPTVTLIGGSTEEWLHKNMPENALEGGLLPRMLIVYEETGKRIIPRPNIELSYDEHKAIREADARVNAKIGEMLAFYNTPRELGMTEEAGHIHDNWYHNRYTLFSPLVQPYAHRARSHIFRMALIAAAARLSPFIEVEDIQFSIEFMNIIAESIDRALLPPNLIFKISKEVLKMLPGHQKTLVMQLSRKHETGVILKALALLQETGQACQKDDVWYTTKGKGE